MKGLEEINQIVHGQYFACTCNYQQQQACRCHHLDTKTRPVDIMLVRCRPILKNNNKPGRQSSSFISELFLGKHIGYVYL